MDKKIRNEMIAIDELLEEHNQLVLEDGGPILPTDEEMSETAKYISEAKHKSKENARTIIRLFPEEKDQLKRM